MPQIVFANHLILSPILLLLMLAKDFEGALPIECSRHQHFQQLINCTILMWHLIFTVKTTSQQLLLNYSLSLLKNGISAAIIFNLTRCVQAIGARYCYFVRD
jgi:hypothetical protein